MPRFWPGEQLLRSPVCLSTSPVPRKRWRIRRSGRTALPNFCLLPPTCVRDISVCPCRVFKPSSFRLMANSRRVSVGPTSCRATGAHPMTPRRRLMKKVFIAPAMRCCFSIPRIEDARRKFGLASGLSAAEVLADPEVRAFFQALIDHLWREGTGSASRPARTLLLVDPPSIDRGELTDKGSINQRAVLNHRSALVDRLYALAPDSSVFLPGGTAR